MGESRAYAERIFIMDKPYSEACDRNRKPILAVIGFYFQIQKMS